jgi:hypothetical protein
MLLGSSSVITSDLQLHDTPFFLGRELWMHTA